MARELKIGDRVVDWKDRAGVVVHVGRHEDGAQHFVVRNDHTGSDLYWDWYEFDGSDPEGTFRFEDTEYPEWPN